MTLCLCGSKVGNFKADFTVNVRNFKTDFTEATKTMLERIYEPVFSDLSHGFRPQRSCHTALELIQNTWRGVKWFIEFDIRGFFDSMNHDIMIGLLEKKIDDKRFIKLIKGMLKAGYLEDWRYHRTYSGTPQGGIVSPILSNIYLNELDCYIEQLAGEFYKGKERPKTPEYQRIADMKYRVRKEIQKQGAIPSLIGKLKELDRQQKEIPSREPYSPKYKRLRYCRYADDFVLGIIGSKAEAVQIKEKVVAFLSDTLKLQVSENKTRIEHARKGILFLNYQINTWRGDKILKRKIKGTYTTQRTVTDGIKLRVPIEKVIQFCNKYGYGDWHGNKPKHRASLLNGTDEEIILTYNSELRGLANYYALADDVKTKLNKLQYLSHYSLFKTLANKHKCNKLAIIKRLRKGSEFIHRYEVKGETREIKVFKLRHLNRQHKDWNVDKTQTVFWLTSERSELTQRMQVRICEYCGKKGIPVEVHHVRKLKDLRKKRHLENWEKVMIARNRKTMILCTECHDLLHTGRLPDNRYKSRKV